MFPVVFMRKRDKLHEKDADEISGIGGLVSLHDREAKEKDLWSDLPRFASTPLKLRHLAP
jgi:hypothetical protein